MNIKQNPKKEEKMLMTLREEFGFVETLKNCKKVHSRNFNKHKAEKQKLAEILTQINYNYKIPITWKC